MTQGFLSLNLNSLNNDLTSLKRIHMRNGISYYTIVFASVLLLFTGCKEKNELNQENYEPSLHDIVLPEPRKTGGKTLLDALNERRSTWDFRPGDLTQEQLSELLWAGFGFNRRENLKRTAPSARNIQEIDIYVALASGLYIYDPASNILREVHSGDIRRHCGTQDFVAEAPVNLIFVADINKLGKKGNENITDSDLLYSYANTGFIAQNIYLYCASENLGCVVRGLINREGLAEEMHLRSDQVIILSQTVGFPL